MKIKLASVIGYNVEVVGVEAKLTLMPVDLPVQVGVEEELLIKLVDLKLQLLDEIAIEGAEPLMEEKGKIR